MSTNLGRHGAQPEDVRFGLETSSLQLRGLPRQQTSGARRRVVGGSLGQTSVWEAGLRGKQASLTPAWSSIQPHFQGTYSVPGGVQGSGIQMGVGQPCLLEALVRWGSAGRTALGNGRWSQAASVESNG